MIEGADLNWVSEVFGLPPWMVDPRYPVPRFPRLRYAVRRVWPLRKLDLPPTTNRQAEPHEPTAGGFFIPPLYLAAELGAQYRMNCR